MKRVRFAEQEEDAATTMTGAAAAAMDDDDGDAANNPDPYTDIRSAEAPAPPRPAPSSGGGGTKGSIPLEPFNMAAERREGLVDARGNLVPFDERRQGGSARRGGRKSGGEGERDAWIEGLEEELEEEEEIAGEMEGVPSRRQRRRRKGGSSSSSSDDSGEGESDESDDDDELTRRPLAEAAPLSGAELRALKLRLARLLKPDETVLAALRRLASPAGIAGSRASAGGLLLASSSSAAARSSSSSSSSSAAAAAAAAADAAAAALSSSPMLRDSIVERGTGGGAGAGAGAAAAGGVIGSAHLPPRSLPLLPPQLQQQQQQRPPSQPRRGRTVPAANLPAFEEVTDLAAALAAAGEARVHWTQREALLDGVLLASPAAVSGRKRRNEGGEGEGEEEAEEADASAAASASEAAAATAAAAAAAAAEINAPGLVINGVFVSVVRSFCPLFFCLVLSQEKNSLSCLFSDI